MIVAIVLFAAAAGCIDAREPGVNISPTTLDVLATPVFVNCDWFSTSMNYPMGHGPGTKPPGWSDPGGLLDGHRILLLTCERVGLGTLERGPMTLSMDVSHRYAAPSSCATPGARSGLVDSMAWTDSSFSNYTRSVWGARTHDIEVQSLGETNERGYRAWEWHLSGDPLNAGSLEFTNGEFDPGPTGNVQKFYWDNGNGISYILLHMEWVDGAVSASTAQGTVPDYTINGYETDWLGAASSYSLDTIRAELHEFGDYRCESPRS